MVRTTDNAAVITRRTRNLERNRVAATKCRRRKNQWQAGLESKKSELESRFRALRGETEALAEEVAQLKHLVMAHAFCNDANIDGWIQNQADNLPRSRTLSEVLPPALAPQPSPSPDTSEEEEEDWPIFDTTPEDFGADFTPQLNTTTYYSQLHSADYVNPSLLTTG